MGNIFAPVYSRTPREKREFKRAAARIARRRRRIEVRQELADGLERRLRLV